MRRAHLVCPPDGENVSDPFKRKLGKIITYYLRPLTTPTPRKMSFQTCGSHDLGVSCMCRIQPYPLQYPKPFKPVSSAGGADPRFPCSAGLSPFLSPGRAGIRTRKLPTNSKRAHT